MSFQIAMDVESALSWAYRDELPKRGAGALSFLRAGAAAGPRNFNIIAPNGFPSVAAGFDMVSGGGAAIDFEREPGFPDAAGEPHPDAILIERAVAGMAKALDAVEADPTIADGLEGFGFDVEHEFRQACRGVVSIITARAKLQDRPICGPELPQAKEKKGPNGKGVVLRLVKQRVKTWQGDVRSRELEMRRVGRPDEEPTLIEQDAITREVEVPSPALRKDSYRIGSYAPLDWTPDPHLIIQRRCEYAAWHAALTLLSQHPDLQKLTKYRLTGPSAPKRPWLDAVPQEKTAPRIVPDIRPAAQIRPFKVERRPRRTIATKKAA